PSTRQPRKRCVRGVTPCTASIVLSLHGCAPRNPVRLVQPLLDVLRGHAHGYPNGKKQRLTEPQTSGRTSSRRGDGRRSSLQVPPRRRRPCRRGPPSSPRRRVATTAPTP